MRRAAIHVFAAASFLGSTGAAAQRTQENALAAASDGFGTTVGNERVGVYTTSNVRGFSPVTAGNRRIEGLYFDLGGNGLTNRLIARSTVRVGLPALAYPFPAPSGIVDYDLRRPGDRSVLSIVASLPAYGGGTLELDGQAHLLRGLSIAGGLGLANNTYVDGRRTDAQSIAVLPEVRSGGSDALGFFGISRTGGSVPPIMVTSGPKLPPLVETSGFKSQHWIDNDQLSYTFGLVTSTPLARGLKLRLGAFQSRSTRRRTFTDLFLNVRDDGSANERVVSDPRLRARWSSGEARLVWEHVSKTLSQKLILALRARDKRLESGGSDATDLGPARLGVLTAYPEPAFSYHTPTVNNVRQASFGIDWIGHLKGGIDFNVGVQRAQYRSAFRFADASTETRARPWLYNASAAYAPARWIGFYAGASTGLEESPPAPPSATNRDDPVPASRTRQVDGGVRIVFGTMRLVVGAFRIERPYYSVGADNLYRALGPIQNKGIEISLAGNLSSRLSLVSGLVLMNPRVVGAAVEEGRVGLRPVGSTTRIGRLDAEYAVGVERQISLLLSLQHSGPIAASTAGYSALAGGQLMVDAASFVDLGGRARFNLGSVPVSLRAQVLNVADTRRFAVSSSNAFLAPERRRFTVQLTADF